MSAGSASSAAPTEKNSGCPPPAWTGCPDGSSRGCGCCTPPPSLRCSDNGRSRSLHRSTRCSSGCGTSKSAPGPGHDPTSTSRRARSAIRRLRRLSFVFGCANPRRSTRPRVHCGSSRCFVTTDPQILRRLAAEVLGRYGNHDSGVHRVAVEPPEMAVAAVCRWLRDSPQQPLLDHLDDATAERLLPDLVRATALVHQAPKLISDMVGSSCARLGVALDETLLSGAGHRGARHGDRWVRRARSTRSAGNRSTGRSDPAGAARLHACCSCGSTDRSTARPRSPRPGSLRARPRHEPGQPEQPAVGSGWSGG